MFALLMTVENHAVQSRRTLPPEECESLLAGIGQGNREAFDTLYRATDRMLYAYALSLTRNHQDAQDIMMETYLKIRSAAHLYKPQGKPLAWIFTIARNLVRSHQRTAGREVLFSDGSETEFAFDPSDRAEDALVLRAALRCLSEEERQIVVLHAVSGMKHRELAELLSLPLSTVLSKYARALAKLKAYLTTQEEERKDG